MTTLDQCVKDADWTHRPTPTDSPVTKVTDATDRDTDALLVERAVSGQRAAYDFLVIKYQHRVASLVSRYARNPADVSDITQEAFVRAWTALPKFRNDSAFYTWLYRIAVNTALNHINGRRRQVNETDLPGDRTIEDGLNHDPGLDGPEADHEATELDRVVAAALVTWPALQGTGGVPVSGQPELSQVSQGDGDLESYWRVHAQYATFQPGARWDETRDMHDGSSPEVF